MRLWPLRAHFYVHDVAVLVAPRPGDSASPGTVAPELRSVEFVPAQAADILQLHRQMAHRMSQPRMDQRFSNGLRYFAFYQDEALLGSTWAAIGGGRYVDEVNWFLPIGPTEFWVRDVFILPAQRGRGLYASLLKLVAQRHVPGCTAAWSDVDWVNRASMRAHARAGFSVHARLRALDLDGRLRLRGAAPAWHAPVTEIDPGKRCLLMRGALLRRHRQLLA
jgi:GNAT superfamily N-acetyltransferase